MKLDSQQYMMDSQPQLLNSNRMFPSFAMDTEAFEKGSRMDNKLEELPQLSIPLLQPDLSMFPGPLSSDLSEATPSPEKQGFDAENSPTKTSYSSLEYGLEHQDATGPCSLNSAERRTVISQEASPRTSEASKENWTDAQSWFHPSRPTSSNAEGTDSQYIRQAQPGEASQFISESEIVELIQSAYAMGCGWKEDSEHAVTNASHVIAPAIISPAYDVPNQVSNSVRYDPSLIANQAIYQPEFYSGGLGISVKAESVPCIDGRQNEAAGYQNPFNPGWRSILPVSQPLHLDFHGAWRTPIGYAPVHTRLQLSNDGSDLATQQQVEEQRQQYGFDRVPVVCSPNQGRPCDREDELDDGYQFSMAELAQIHLQNARNRSISKMPLSKLYEMMGLENDPAKAKWREECIIELVRNEGFDVGNQTWIRDTEDSTRKRIIESIHRQTKEFGYTCELLEIIVRRGTYARMQSKLRQRRRHSKKNLEMREIHQGM